MNIPEEFLKEVQSLPPELRAVLEAELAAGNTIAEVGHDHPAAPVGAWLKMARTFSTKPDAVPKGVKFRRRNSSLWSGEYSDANGFFFLLDPGLPYEEPMPLHEFYRRREAQEREALAQCDHTPVTNPGYTVERDWRGETACYIEPDRRVTLFSAWHGGAVGHVAHISGQWEYKDRPHADMTPQEQAEVLQRVIDFIRRHDGFVMVAD
jgi:hypothetical protein